jgi:Putative auto-transporter adhesin, head GIN domain
MRRPTSNRHKPGVGSDVCRAGAAAVVLLFTQDAWAADRTFTVTDFDRIEVDGAFDVSVETGKSPTVRASGSTTAVDQLLVEVRARTLRIRPARTNWGGWPGEKPAAPKIKVTAPALKDASLRGSGTLSVSRMRAATVRVFQVGGGQVLVGAVESDQIIVSQTGSGLVTLSGKALLGKVTSDGSGRIAAERLSIGDLTLQSGSAGALSLLAVRSAKVVSNGSGEIVILGSPACTVSAVGPGQVRCGK